MARLASQATAGFFPTPPRVVAALCHLVVPARERARQMIRVLDPCAGSGEPIAALARALGAESYGIEINGERAEQCRHQVDHVLATSAFTVRLARARHRHRAAVLDHLDRSRAEIQDDDGGA